MPYIKQEQAEKLEVNGFLGYAISKVLGKYKNKRKQKDVDNTHNKESTGHKVNENTTSSSIT